MTFAVASAVLLAALMHAGWNALLRFHGDRLSMVTQLAACSGLLALPAAMLLGFPNGRAAPWLAASVSLHVGYNVFLASAYSHGDLARVYPLARGTAPLLTLIVGSALFHQSADPMQAAGIGVLAGGILILAFEDGWRGLKRSPQGAGYALVTAVFIAGYTLCDGLGARAAGNPHAYVSWLFVLNGTPLLLYGMARGRRKALRAVGRDWPAGMAAGLLSLAAYWIAIWAMTVAPIALVAALRECSVVFAVLIGIWFGESITWVRAVSLCAVMIGLFMLRT